MRFLAICFLLLAPAWSHAAPRVDTEAELELANRINRERCANGLDVLRFDASLRTLARYHSADMVLARFVGEVSPSHGPLAARVPQAAGLPDSKRHPVGVVTRVAVAAEAVGSALEVSILDPSVTRLGVGIVGDDQGRLFLTVVAVAAERPQPADAATVAPHGKPRPVARPRTGSLSAFLARTLLGLSSRNTASR